MGNAAIQGFNVNGDKDGMVRNNEIIRNLQEVYRIFDIGWQRVDKRLRMGINDPAEIFGYGPVSRDNGATGWVSWVLVDFG